MVNFAGLRYGRGTRNGFKSCKRFGYFNFGKLETKDGNGKKLLFVNWKKFIIGNEMITNERSNE